MAKPADKRKNWHISICQLFDVLCSESTLEKIGILDFVTSRLEQCTINLLGFESYAWSE